MKILHTVESYTPLQHGMQEVVKQISEKLVEKGHEVWVATRFHPDRKMDVINGVKIATFKIFGNMVNGYTGTSEEINAYQKFVRDSGFDVITSFAAQQWATDLILPILSEIKAKKVFVPTGFSALYNDQYANYFEQMKIWMSQYDMNIFLSDNYRDINFARENGINNNIIIPNGASAEEFLSNDSLSIRKKFKIPEDAFLILSVGSHTGLKGHKEAVYIFDKAKIANAVLLVVGNKTSIIKTSLKRKVIEKLKDLYNNKMPEECPAFCLKAEKYYNKLQSWKVNKKRLIITDISRRETVAAYKNADIFLFPSNIECSPIVLFESNASKTPFLSTDVGNSAEMAKWTGGGMILPTKKDGNERSHADIDGSAKMLEQVYSDKELRNDMAESGFIAWKERFTWEAIAERYELLYKDLLA